MNPLRRASRPRLQRNLQGRPYAGGAFVHFSLRRISVTVSSRGSSDLGWRDRAVGPVVAQQCPQDVDQAPGQREQSLGVDLVLVAFALVVVLRWPVGADAGQSHHVEEVPQWPVEAL